MAGRPVRVVRLMAKSVTVYAARAFSHSGTAVSVGDPLTVSPIEAAALNYRKLATLHKPKALPKVMTVEPEPEPEQPKRRRRTYKRRDLRAEE